MSDVIPCGDTVPLIQWKKDTFRFFLWTSASDLQEVNDAFTMMEHSILTVLQYRASAATCSEPLRCRKLEPYAKSTVVEPQIENYYKKRDRPLWGLGLVVRYRLFIKYKKEVTCD